MIEELKEKKKKYKIIAITTLILSIIFFASLYKIKNTTIQIIFAFAFIIGLIIFLTLNAKIKLIEEKIYNTEKEEKAQKYREINRRKRIQQRAQEEIEIEIEKNRIRKINRENNNSYNSKSIMTDWEKEFYKTLQNNFSENYNVMAQVPLSSIVNKEKKYINEYQGELYRTIDFGIFNNNFEPLLLIELNDKTHNSYQRKIRDEKVKEICNIANIKLMTIWSNDERTNKEIIEEIKGILENE